MKFLIAGATGATGRLLTQQLLDRGHSVTVIVRSAARLPEAVQGHPNLTAIEASLLDLTDAQLTQYVADCDGVASCLGHNLTFKGIFMPPRRLVTDATRRLSQAIVANQPAKPVKFVLMNTTGNRNPDQDNRLPFADALVVKTLSVVLPPQRDNELAADYLRSKLGRNNPFVNWVVVRPDGLTNETDVTPYHLCPAPLRSPIFNSGKTSRINVAHFMAELLADRDSWTQWQGQMPVIYNLESAAEVMPQLVV